MPSKKMSLNLDDETDFGSGINNKLILILMNLHIYKDLYSTLYEILFIYVHEKKSKYIN